MLVEAGMGSSSAPLRTKQKSHRKGGFFVGLVEAAGIEPASASPLPSVLHA